MSDIAIRVEKISKKYTLGELLGQNHNIYTAFSSGLKRLFRKSPRAELHQAETTLDAKNWNGKDGSSNIFWALRDVSFEVKRGEVIGIIGFNGAGKSTLLKILSKITVPTSGRAEIYGRVASLLEVGTGFHPELTGRENIYMNGALLGMKKNEIADKFDEIIDFSGIERFVDTPVKRYSSGMYVRLAFAVAANLEQEVLIVDEVLAVGDAVFQKKCLGKMGKVAQEGRTILFVSHNMAAVRNLCSRAILLENGQKKIEESTDLVISEYIKTSTSELSSQVDLPPAIVDAEGRGVSLFFYDNNDKPKAQFCLNEKWKMVLEFEMYRFMPQVRGSVGLMTLDSIPIITHWSSPNDLRPGYYRIEFECDTPLKACDLQVMVALLSEGRIFYATEALGHVSISPVAFGKQPILAVGHGLLLSYHHPEIIPIS